MRKSIITFMLGLFLNVFPTLTFAVEPEGDTFNLTLGHELKVRGKVVVWVVVENPLLNTNRFDLDPKKTERKIPLGSTYEFTVYLTDTVKKCSSTYNGLQKDHHYIVGAHIDKEGECKVSLVPAG